MIELCKLFSINFVIFNLQCKKNDCWIEQVREQIWW